ncbi:MAG: tetratricopeptide repeat protein, partial [Stellaceae bacterium]
MTNISHSPRSSDRHASFARQAPLRVALCALLLAGCTTGGPQGVGDRAGRQDPATVSGDVSSSAVLRIAESLRASGDLATAVSFYRRAIQIDPNQVKPYIGLGETLLAAGYANPAAESFRAALSMAPDNADAMRGLGMTLVALDKPTEAVEMLNKSINFAPSPRAFSALGVAENLMGNTAAATAAFKRGLAMTPEDLDLLNNYGLSQALAGDYDGAIATLHRVATDPRASSRNRLNLALVLGLAGRSEDAAQVARIDLDEKAVRSNLAYYAELRALSPKARAQAILRPGKPLLAQTAPASTCDAPSCAPPVIGDKASAAPAVPVASTPRAAAAPQKSAADPAAAAEPKTAAAPKPAKHAKK